MALLGCIADDFTGATDLAGLIARAGVTVSLRLGIPDEPPEESSDVEVIALKCRTAPASEAVLQCGNALEWLMKTGATQFFWKYCSTFDSTKAGNIGPVAQALMQQLDVGQTIYCPAFPENGRRVFMGNLFVGQQPLGESPMKDHPLTPMRDSDLRRLLSGQLENANIGLIDWPTIASGPEAVRTALGQFSSRGVQHVIVDAIADSDLAVIARATADFPLLTGGSALGRALPDIWREKGLISASAQAFVPPATGSGTIVLSGSCSAMTREQVAAYRDCGPHLQLDPLQIAAYGLKSARAWLAAQNPELPAMIYATAEPGEVAAAQDKLGVARTGEVIEDALAQLARDARSLGRARFVIAGGETSGAVIQALGIKRLMVGKEIAPGVPWTFAKDEQGSIALALKSGNFGAKSFFSDAFARL